MMSICRLLTLLHERFPTKAKFDNSLDMMQRERAFHRCLCKAGSMLAIAATDSGVGLISCPLEFIVTDATWNRES